MIVLLVDGIQAIKAVGSTTAPTAEPRWTVMTMRLIDADALVADRSIQIVIGAGDNICVDIADINKAPTIEAEPVRHGRWVASEPDSHDCIKHICSECGKYRLFMWSDYTNCNYCPNCGAKMDGDQNEHDCMGTV